MNWLKKAGIIVSESMKTPTKPSILVQKGDGFVVLSPGKQVGSVDLSGINLSGVDLHGIDLHDANLSGSTLVDVNFSDANLSGVDLSSATLSGVNFDNAKIENIKFDNAVISPQVRASLHALIPSTAALGLKA